MSPRNWLGSPPRNAATPNWRRRPFPNRNSTATSMHCPQKMAMRPGNRGNSRHPLWLGAKTMKRTRLAYGILLGVWGIIAAWQTVEHHRVKMSARAALIKRSKDIADIITGVIGSASFRGIVIQDRLESALNRLVKPGELISVALLNASNDVVAAVGSPMDPELTGNMQERDHWGQKTVTFVSPVYLGGGSATEDGTNYPPILVQPPPPRRDFTN